jgi:predicted nucleic acid-binding protein
MPFVVDASIAASWLLPDEGHPAATTAYDRLTTEPVIVPALWWFEMRNIFIVNERRGRLDSGKTDKALALLNALPIQQDNKPDEALLMRMARQYRLTAYDAAYLELAVRETLSLATLDAALASAASAAGVELIR